MLKEYTIADILQSSQQAMPYFVGRFEGTDDPEIDWPHRHAFYSMVWFTEGSGFYVVDFQEYEIKKDRMFFVAPKQVHNWDYSENSKGYVLMTDNALAAELNTETPYPYVDITSERNLINSVFDHMLEEYTRQDTLSDRSIKTGIRYLYSISERIAGDSENKHFIGDNRLLNLRRLVCEDQNLQKVEQYARKMNLSEEAFNSLVKTSTGISAKQYILDLKITEAKRQLIYSQFNINEIAFSLGFDDPSYFTRLFRKKTNLSPSVFLKKYRKEA